MCGIWGILSTKKIAYPKNTLLDCFYSIKHRGTNSSVLIDKPNYMIGIHDFIEFAISESQPFVYQQTNGSIERTTYICFDGQMYTCPKSLMKMFLDLGVEQMVEKLDGSFVVSIFDFYKNNETGELVQHLWIMRDCFGIKPLFYTEIVDGTNQTVCFGSEMKSLTNIETDTKILQIDPRTWYHWTFDLGLGTRSPTASFEKKIYWAVGSLPLVLNPYPQDIYDTTRRLLTDSIIECMKTNPTQNIDIGCILSEYNIGSYLIASIGSQELKKSNRVLRTFSIGYTNSVPDPNIQAVSDHIGSVHKHFTFGVQEWVDCIEKVIGITETFDVKTVRSSIQEYLLYKKIADYSQPQPNIKILLTSDCVDDVASGHSYFKNAPDPYSLHFESKRLLHWVHYFDVLKTDRVSTFNGLNVKMPFLSKQFVEFYFQIDPKLRVPVPVPVPVQRVTNTNTDTSTSKSTSTSTIAKYDKYLLRKSFEQTNLLPKHVLWDNQTMCSFDIDSEFKTYVDCIVTNEYFEKEKSRFGEPELLSKEALLYRQIYDSHYPNQSQNTPYYWIPKWTNTTPQSCSPITSTLNNFHNLGPNMGLLRK